MIELWRHRRWIWDSSLSDLRHRYAGSGLGVFWNLVNPIITLAVYVFIFSRVMIPRFSAAQPSTVSFPLYLIAGLLPWITFAEGLVRTTQSLLLNAVHLKKVAIPELVFVATAVVSGTLSMLIAVALLPGLALLLGEETTWTWLLLPVIVIIWQMFGFGVGLALSTVNVFFRDVSQILVVALQIWMWSLPIVYFEDLLPATYRSVLPFNPVYPFMTALRGSVMGTSPSFSTWAAMLCWALVAVAAGFTVVSRLRSEIRDVL